MNKLLYSSLKEFYVNGCNNKGDLIMVLNNSTTQREGSSLRVYYYDECNYSIQFQSHICPDMDWGYS